MFFRNNKARLLAAAAFLSAATAEVSAGTLMWLKPLVIHNDRGGEVIRYALKAKKLKKSGTQVRFAGRCSSACTLYLSLPAYQTCVTKGASFGFHRAYGASSRANDMASEFMMRTYPAWVRGWLGSKGGLTNNIKTMPYSYAVNYIKPCE